MKRNLVKAILFAMAVFFLVGGACPSNETTQSNKVAQTEIFQSYSIQENGGKLEVMAFFRIGGETGTTLALVSPSKVLFNGQPMTEHLNTNSGTYYSIETASGTPSAEFQFTDRKGKVYTNKIDLAKVATPAKNISANGITPVSIPFSRPLTDQSKLTVKLSSPTNSETFFVGPIFESEISANKSSLILKPEAFKEFQRGNLSLSLEVSDSIPLQQGTNLGGNISFSYQTAPVSIALLKSGKQTVANASASKNLRRTAKR